MKTRCFLAAQQRTRARRRRRADRGKCIRCKQKKSATIKVALEFHQRRRFWRIVPHHCGADTIELSAQL